MTRTARKMFKDIGYEYSEEYITDDITNEKVLERIQYKKGYETIKGYPQSEVENTAVTSVSIVKQPDFQSHLAVHASTTDIYIHYTSCMPEVPVSTCVCFLLFRCASPYSIFVF